MRVIVIILLVVAVTQCVDWCAGSREEDIQHAVDDIVIGQCSVHQAAQAYMIPRSTIHITHQMNPPPPPPTNPSQQSHNSILNMRQEDLVIYIVWMSSHGFPIDTSIVAQLAVVIVAIDGRFWAAEHRIWCAQRFVKRHDIASRCPNYVTKQCS